MCKDLLTFDLCPPAAGGAASEGPSSGVHGHEAPGLPEPQHPGGDDPGVRTWTPRGSGVTAGSDVGPDLLLSLRMKKLKEEMEGVVKELAENNHFLERSAFTWCLCQRSQEL